MYRNEVHDG